MVRRMSGGVEDPSDARSVRRNKSALASDGTQVAGAQRVRNFGRLTGDNGQTIPSGLPHVANDMTCIFLWAIKNGKRMWWCTFVRKKQSCGRLTPSSIPGRSGVERRRSRSTRLGAREKAICRDGTENRPPIMILRSSRTAPTDWLRSTLTRNASSSNEVAMRLPNCAYHGENAVNHHDQVMRSYSERRGSLVKMMSVPCSQHDTSIIRTCKMT